jgi:hypothetical protein
LTWYWNFSESLSIIVILSYSYLEFPASVANLDNMETWILWLLAKSERKSGLWRMEFSMWLLHGHVKMICDLTAGLLSEGGCRFQGGTETTSSPLLQCVQLFYLQNELWSLLSFCLPLWLQFLSAQDPGDNDCM